MKTATLGFAAAAALALATMASAQSTPDAANPAAGSPTMGSTPDAANPAASAPTVASTADADGAFLANGRFNEPDGEKLYRRVCAACHMPDAEGAVGAGFYPALASNPKLEAGAYPAYVVVNGLNGMPPFGAMMTDRQVAEVVNYVRTHFGNAYTDPVTEEQVRAMR